MSRNSEKAQSMLYRFREQQAAELGVISTGGMPRPRNITAVDSIPQCEKWRAQVVREISRKVTKINDSALSEPQIRDLNDEINKLMKEKFVWELHLKDLGGANYLRFGTRMFDEQGRELPTTRGYKYYGRARELPGVKELFDALINEGKDAVIPPPPRDLSASYYGLGQEDPKMIEEENELSEAVLAKFVDEDVEFESIPDMEVPSVEEVERYLVERRKRQMEDKYLPDH
jgi:pre-mRNA-splicing factor ISY1